MLRLTIVPFLTKLPTPRRPQLRAELARALRHKRSAEEQLQQLKTAPSEQVEAFRASMQNMTRETAAARRASCEHRGQIATLEQELTMCKEEARRAAERSEGSVGCLF